MATKSFTPDSAPSVASPDVDLALGDGDAPDNLPVSASYFKNSRMSGDYDAKDIIIPRLQLTHGVGPLSEHFAPGLLVFNKAHSLGGGPLNITLLGMKKFFLEDVEYGSEVIARRFDSVEEFRAAGLKLITEKPRGEAKGAATYAKPVLDAHILIEVPAGNAAEAEAFHEFGGKNYLEASITLQSINYSRVAKLWITASQMALRKGLHLRPWHLTTKREKFGVNFVWTLATVMQNAHAAEQVAWIEREVLQIAE